MKKITVLLLIILCFGISFYLFSQNNKKAMLHYPEDTYKQAWEKVKDYENQGLPKSALEEVNTIYKKAKKENNPGQLVKAVIHKLKFMSATEEDALAKSLEELRIEAEQSKFPVKPILHSMLAEMYWKYYEQNQWYILQRSTTENFKQDDIRTWDVKKLVEQTVIQYQASLANADSLQLTSIDIYDAVLNTENASVPDGRVFRPTLYDFLAHRASDFFTSSEPQIAKPGDDFLINKNSIFYDLSNPYPDKGENGYFNSAEDFINCKISAVEVNKNGSHVIQKPDSTYALSFKYNAITILQDLLRFHNKDKTPDALVYVDLKRLSFVYQNYVGEEKDSLYLNALQKLEQEYSKEAISTEVSYQIAFYYYGQSRKYNPLNLEDNKWDAKKGLQLCEEAIQRFPNSTGAKNCQSLQSSIQQKTLNLKLEDVNLPDQPFRTLVTYQNLNKIYFRVIKTNSNELDNLKKEYYRKTQNGSYDIDYDQFLLDFYVKKQAVQQFTSQLPDDKDYQQHKTELELPALAVGEYLILSATDPTFTYQKQAVSFAFTTISNLSYIHRSKGKSLDFYILNRKTGEPMQGVKAELHEERYNYNNRYSEYSYPVAASYISDKEGYFNIPPSKKGRSFYLELSYQNDKLYTLMSENSENQGGNSYKYVPFQQGEDYETPAQTYTQTFLFTDRAIYRPGQIVYFKGIVLDKNNAKEQAKIKVNYPETVTLYDVNGQQVAHLDLTTNEYGSYSGSFTAPSGGLNGQMFIQTNHGSVYFSVEDYKRPKFEVKIVNPKGIYRLNDSVLVTGKAMAYSGANIDGAAVSYRVVRTANFPFWWYCLRGYYPSSPQVEITNGISTTDENGEFKINFTALPDLTVPAASQPTFTYQVIADVTDLNGETHSSSQYVPIGYTALQINTDIPEQVNNTDKNEFAIHTSNLSGEFEALKGTISIHKLKNPDKAFRTRLWERPDKFTLSKDEFYKAFPNDLYDDEDNFFKWEKEKEVLRLSMDTEKEKMLSLKDIKNWPQGKYVLEITAKDKYGAEIKEVKYFTVFDGLMAVDRMKVSETPNIPLPAIDWFNPIKTTVEPNETAKILVGSSESVKVLYEIEQQGKIIQKEWLKLAGGQHLLSIPIKEEYRGNLGIHYIFIKNNRLYTHDAVITVPYTNKQLDITFETFRNKLLPGEKEEWKLLIKGKNGEKLAAEMLATLYDASLDAFRPNNWNFNIYNSYYNQLNWEASTAFTSSNFRQYDKDWNTSVSGFSYSYDYLNWFDYPFYQYFANREGAFGGSDASKVGYQLDETVVTTRSSAKSVQQAPSSPETKFFKDDALKKPIVLRGQAAGITTEPNGLSGDLAGVQTRKNFNETAFFYPHLRTNEKGEIIIAFTIPEALTKWKMMGLAHTKDLKYGFTQNELVTQKDLIMVPNAPRFFREGDQISFTTKITNLSDKDLNGETQLELFDALTMKPLEVIKGTGSYMYHIGDIETSKEFPILKSAAQQSFQTKKGQSTLVSWNLQIPEGVQAITYKVIAKAGNFSDGEEMAVPVLTNRMLVTETLPLSVRGNQPKTFMLDKLINNKSTTLRNHKLTLEYSSNPAWYAVQALPYLMEYPYECAEQTFNRFYANSLAAHVSNSNPKLKQVFDSWKNYQPEALLSNLEKNQELKSLLLEETPWVRDAQNESERKKRIALLFDLNKMADELQRALNKLIKMQASNGAWAWFEGMPEDRYMTQYIVSGLGHLDHLGVKSLRTDQKTWGMTRKAVLWLDYQIQKDYQEILREEKKGHAKLSDNHLSNEIIQYFYARSYFKDVTVDEDNQKAFAYFKGQLGTYWKSYLTSTDKYTEGMIALAMHRYGYINEPQAIVKSLKQYALTSDEMGMYWKENVWGYYWYQAPIETQALMIEVFDEVAQDQKAVDELKVWLLKQKQTQDWKTTKATAEACYALLLRGDDWLNNSNLVDITIGSQKIDVKQMGAEAGTGYIKTSWSGSEIKPEMGKITVTPSTTQKGGVSWGALYWQYFEQLDKITPSKTSLQLKKQLFLQKNTPSGPVIVPIDEKTALKPGDKVKVRIELRADRNMEYVHLKDMRASCFEPLNVISQYKWQDGLGYYESTRDAATNFFFGYLPKGTYVFEYPLYVTHKGNFSNGITTIQCMYAPEFSSHSEGIRVQVK